MAKLLIKNIKGIINAREQAPALHKGEEMKDLPVLENAWMAVEDGLIADFGSMDTWPGISDWRDLEVLDAEGKYLFPGWVDSHTHTVFASSRESEFVDRINGLSYQEIAERGGGILNSARKLAEMDEETLYIQSHQRAMKLIRMGTAALEIKSGYGLSKEAELKMLRVIKRLKEELPIPVKATYLAAHAIPAEYKGRNDDYMKDVVLALLPEIAEQGLADYVDIFIEDGYFTVEQGESLLSEAKRHGLKGKIHVNQFSTMGGVQLGVKHDCLSVDHLEELSQDDIQALQGSSVMPVALPSCSFFLSIPYTPARELMNAGLPVALATDYNPGSTPSGNMNFVVALACIKMKMTPEEAILAATQNAAYALELDQELGSITPGKRANFFLTKHMPSYAYLPYSFGEDLISSVYVNGFLMD